MCQCLFSVSQVLRCACKSQVGQISRSLTPLLCKSSCLQHSCFTAAVWGRNVNLTQQLQNTKRKWKKTVSCVLFLCSQHLFFRTHSKSQSLSLKSSSPGLSSLREEPHWTWRWAGRGGSRRWGWEAEFGPRSGIFLASSPSSCRVYSTLRCHIYAGHSETGGLAQQLREYKHASLHVASLLTSWHTAVFFSHLGPDKRQRWCFRRRWLAPCPLSPPSCSAAAKGHNKANQFLYNSIHLSLSQLVWVVKRSSSWRWVF